MKEKPIKYMVGHTAYADNSANHAKAHATIRAVYRDLRSRGVSVPSARLACKSVRRGSFTTVRTKGDSEVIEAKMFERRYIY